jgi:hypothetical protein
MPRSHLLPKPLVPSLPRADALAGGELVDAMAPPFLEVTLQYLKVPVAMSAAVYAVIQHAVENPRYSNDFAGVWQHICSVLRTTISRQREDSTQAELSFRVMISGAARSPYWTLSSLMGPGDQGEPCLTICLPHEAHEG